MSTIPFNQVVNILPGVLTAAGNAVDLNAVVLSQSQYAPQNQVLNFSTSLDVSNWFGSSSVEAQIAAGYFQGPDNATATPGLLKFLGYAENAVAGWLLGIPLPSLTLSQLQALSGTLSITVGGTLYTSSTLNFAPLATPVQTASSTAATGGSIAAGTYYSKVTAINSLGETIGSNEENIVTTGATSTLTFNWNVVAGATGYKVYVGTAAGAENVFATEGAVTTATITVLPVGTGTPPVTNTTSPSSFSAAAAAIQAAFTAPTFTVAYDALHQAFLITSSTTGASETITYCTGTLAASLGLDANSAGILSQGAAAATPAAQMNWLTAHDQNWASFLTSWASQLTEREAFATWATANAPRYWYLPWDTDVADLTANNAASFGGWLAANKQSGSSPFYGTQQHAAFAASWAASLDFTRRNGRSTLDKRSQVGLATSVTDTTSYTNVKSNGYNMYAAFGSNNPANNDQWMTPGVVCGPFKWADTYVCQIKLNADLQLAVIRGMRSVGQIPYNSDGDAMMEGFCRDPINAALNFGTIRKGVTLSASQVQQVINLVGADVSATITAQGYYLFTNAAGTQASVRTQRGSPPATLLYQDGESIQSFTMPSIVIQ